MLWYEICGLKTSWILVQCSIIFSVVSLSINTVCSFKNSTHKPSNSRLCFIGLYWVFLSAPLLVSHSSVKNVFLESYPRPPPLLHAINFPSFIHSTPSEGTQPTLDRRSTAHDRSIHTHRLAKQFTPPKKTLVNIFKSVAGHSLHRILVAFIWGKVGFVLGGPMAHTDSISTLSRLFLCYNYPPNNNKMA